MRLKLDENLPGSLVPALRALGHDVDTALNEGLQGAHDPAVFSASQNANRFLITQDLDFSDVRQFEPGTHDGILLVRLRHPGRRALYARVLSLFQVEAVESWERCFVVTTDSKTRVRRPR